MRRDDPRHGTPAGYRAHRKEGKRACRPCLNAQSAYMQSRRATPAFRKRERQRNAAAARAVWRLADLHRDEYERLYVEELMTSRPELADTG